MPGPATLVSLAIFFALGVLVAVLVWRLFVLGGKLRQQEEQQRAAVEVARASAGGLGELAKVVDAVRRRKADPRALEELLRGAAQEAGRHRVEVGALAGNTSVGEMAGALATEIGKAERAIALISHGVEMLIEDGGSHAAEGETDVKRGYLALLQARDEIAAEGEEMAGSSQARPRRWRRWN